MTITVQVLKSDPSAAFMARIAAFRLLHCMCQTLEAEAVRSFLNEHGGTQVCISADVIARCADCIRASHHTLFVCINQSITKAALDEVRKQSLPDASLLDLARETRCAAFSFAAALFVATQTKEKVFNAPLRDGVCLATGCSLTIG